MVAHSKVSSLCLITLLSSLAAAQVHGTEHHARHLAQFGAGPKDGFQMLKKRQAAGARPTAASPDEPAADEEADTPTSAAAATAVTQAATTAAAATNSVASARSSNLVDSILDTLLGNDEPATSAATEPATTEATSAVAETSAASAATSRASAVVTSVQTSAEIESSAESSAARPSVVVVTSRASLASSATSSSVSASASAAAQEEETGSSGLSKPTLIIIIVVASSVALVAAIWTIVRKTAFGTSKRFDKKLRPISEFETIENQHSHSAIPGLDRSNSSAVGGGGPAGYAHSLGRSDSGKGSVRNDGGYPASIPYNGPAYTPAPYYGNAPSPVFNQGYPQQQAYGYTDLQRGATGRSYSSQNSAGAYDYNSQQPRFQPRY